MPEGFIFTNTSPYNRQLAQELVEAKGAEEYLQTRARLANAAIDTITGLVRRIKKSEEEFLNLDNLDTEEIIQETIAQNDDDRIVMIQEAIAEAQKQFQNFPEIKEVIIESLYISLIREETDQERASEITVKRILPPFQIYFGALIRLGAQCEHLYFDEEKKEIFNHLALYALSPDLLTWLLNRVLFSKTKYSIQDYENMADELLLYGADINGKVSEQDSGGILHYCIAAKRTYPGLITYLESKLEDRVHVQVVDYTVLDQEGNTALMAAIRAYQEPLVLEILSQSEEFDINHRNQQGQSALMLAASLGMVSVVEKLIDLGAIQDNLAQYASFDRGHIKQARIFCEAVVKPEQSSQALDTYLLDSNGIEICYQVIGEEQVEDPRVLLSNDPESQRIQQEVVKCIREKINHNIPGAREWLTCVLRQLDHIKNTESVMDVCLRNQIKVRELLAKQPSVTLHVTSSAEGDPKIEEVKEEKGNSSINLVQTAESKNAPSAIKRTTSCPELSRLSSAFFPAELPKRAQSHGALAVGNK